MEFGVERLTLPAAPSVVDTWVTSFGFSKMTDSERLRFLDYTLLDFQDSVMCQKLLMKIPSTNSSQSTGIFAIPSANLIKRRTFRELACMLFLYTILQDPG